MGIECTFELNDRPMSTLKCGPRAFDAFSGEGTNRNRRASACMVGSGPLPPGKYYIVDRPSGGVLGTIRDYFGGKDEWFALYADDGKIDDEMFCDKLARGQFRLHPKGPLGISKGCITMDKANDFAVLKGLIRAQTMKTIPGTTIGAYGTVIVK